MVTRVAWQTPAGARPNRRREAVLFDEDAAGRPLEGVGDCARREMTVRSSPLRQNPAYRPGDSHPLLPRRLFFRALAIVVLVVSACRSPIPQQPISVRGPDQPPDPVRQTSWVLTPSLLSRDYHIEQRATIVTTLDSGAAFVDSASIAVEATLREVGDGSSAGLIQSVVVTAPGLAPTSMPGLNVPFAFVAQRLSATPALQLTPLPRPVVRDPCESKSDVPLGVLRDFLIVPPGVLAIGGTWSDSGSYITCRDGARLNVFSRRTFHVAAHDTSGGRGVLLVDRRSVTDLEGRVVRGEDTTRVSGSGTGTMRLVLDASSGSIISADGAGFLDVLVRGSTREERARQTFVSTAVLRVP